MPVDPKIVISLGLAILVGCDRGLDPESPAPDLGTEVKTDAFAGKTVSGLQHAFEMVHTRLRNAPIVGMKAPATTLIDANSGRKVELNNLFGKKPVALVFGSGSCSATNANLKSLEALAREYREKVEFFFVYLREAHPEGGFQPEVAGRYAEANRTSIVDAASLTERRKAAQSFGRLANLDFPILIDQMNDEAAVQWGGWPARLFVVDTDGTVLYAGGQGPWYYHPSDELIHQSPGEGVEEFSKLPYDQRSLSSFLKERYR